MSDYTPDNWVVLKLTQQLKTGNTGYGRKEQVLYKVLAGWSGGYLDSRRWRMNSGIVDVEETDDSYIFIGNSGSRYVCNKTQNQLRMNTSGIYNQLKEQLGDQVELMPEDTDWWELYRC